MKISKELYEKISDATFTDYEPLEIINNEDGLYIETEKIESMLEDLLYEIDSRQEIIEDLEQDIEDNYKPITKQEMYLG